MAFGLAVSDYTVELGTYGKLLKLDIRTYLPRKMVGAIGEDASKVKSDFVVDESTLAEIMGYLDSVNCPNVAYHLQGNTLYIFLKHDVYDERFSFALKRNFKPMVEETDKLDIPEDLYYLFKLLVKKIAGLSDKSDDQKIYNEEQKIIALS